MNKHQKPVIYWILQDNQVTPFIVDFLTLLKQRVHEFAEIKYLIAAHNTEALKTSKKLKPVPYHMTSSTCTDSYEGFCKKRDLIGDHEFSDGLSLWRTLLLDDLGSGNLFRADLHMKEKENIHGIILQIPTPLGSSVSEERTFYSWVYTAKQSNIPIFGYELLPLDTRWTLAPSLLQGVIASTQDSFKHLSDKDTGMNNKLWLIPRYEGRFFSPSCTPLWRNGLGTAYKYQKELKIPMDRTIIYIPHNVAMTYEYKKLVSFLKPFEKKIHIMFCIGKDQIRGTHKHDEIIKIVCKNDLKTISHSFHDLNSPWEITMADCVAGCASCYTSSISAANNIPTIIYDPMVKPNKNNFKKSVSTIADFTSFIDKIILTHNNKTEFAKIIFQIINRNFF